MAPPSDDSQPGRETVEPVSLKAKAPPSPAAHAGPQRDDQLRRFTLAGFGVLLLLAIGVFFLLPAAVERNREAERGAASPEVAEGSEAEVVEEPEARSQPALPGDPAALAARSAAEESLTDFVALTASLEAQDVASWAADPFAEAQQRAREAEHMLRDRLYRDAADRMAEAVDALRQLELRGQSLFEEALRAGAIALEAGSAADAREQFGIGLRIRPGDRVAEAGLARAETIEEAFALLLAGSELEESGQLEAARDRYEAGVALDPELQSLHMALARVREQLTRRAFETAMSNGFAALSDARYGRAEAAFREALRIRPGAPSARDGLAQAVESARTREVARHGERADQFETEERWHEALAEYEAALTLDPDVGFAQQGSARTRQRAELSDALDAFLNAPQRLSAKDVRSEAARTLARADTVRTPGPVLRSQIDSLAKLLHDMSTPVLVELVSDAETEVLVYHVGRLGRFEARRLELTPGRYTVVGTRAGYRDFRTEFTVGAGHSPPPVVVRCEEKI
jgi:tetratricopeptide (TPR) repeat protein